MKLSVISFTAKGAALSIQLFDKLGKEPGVEICLYTKCSLEKFGASDVSEPLKISDSSEPLEPSKLSNPLFRAQTDFPVTRITESVGEWAAKQMEEKNTLLFIGACGIAVRAIAPHIVDKLHDSPVLVMDEMGRYVIPILSGHVGGANEIALLIAEKLGAVPVITTATDINGKFAVDLFAKRNGFAILNKDGIAKVSAKALADEEITMSIETGADKAGAGADRIRGNIPQGIRLISYPPRQFADIVITTEERSFDAALTLKPREYIIGMGCRRGKEKEKIKALIERSLKGLGISADSLLALASIEQKKDEQGFLEWSREANIPFWTYTAAELAQVEGEFESSDFVKEQVGVDNVCERAALKGCGQQGRLILSKQAEDGMTIAIAKRNWSVVFDEE